MLRLIALFKFFKVACLILVGIGALRLMHNDLGDTLGDWASRLHLAPGNHYVDLALERAANIPPGKIKYLGIGSFVYAALFLTEGIGLWLEKRWGEWFTVLITASLVPLEVYELVRHASWIKAVVLVLNLLVVVYLVLRIRNPGASLAGSRAESSR